MFECINGTGFQDPGEGDPCVDAAEGQLVMEGLGVGSGSGSGVESDESISISSTAAPGSRGKSSGGVKEKVLFSTGSSAIMGGGELGNTSVVEISSTETTLPRLFVRSISVPSFDVPLGRPGLGLRARS